MWNTLREWAPWKFRRQLTQLTHSTSQRRTDNLESHRLVTTVEHHG